MSHPPVVKYAVFFFRHQLSVLWSRFALPIKQMRCIWTDTGAANPSVEFKLQLMLLSSRQVPVLCYSSTVVATSVFYKYLVILTLSFHLLYRFADLVLHLWGDAQLFSPRWAASSIVGFLIFNSKLLSISLFMHICPTKQTCAFNVIYIPEHQ